MTAEIIIHVQPLLWKHLLREVVVVVVVVVVFVLSKEHGMHFMELFSIVGERSKFQEFSKMVESSETRIVT